jgi:hypothetical protein
MTARAGRRPTGTSPRSEVDNPASAPASFDDLSDADCALTSVTADGNHSIYAASIDSDDNVESTLASASLKIDATPPSLSPSLSTIARVSYRGSSVQTQLSESIAITR